MPVSRTGQPLVPIYLRRDVFFDGGGSSGSNWPQRRTSDGWRKKSALEGVTEADVLERMGFDPDDE